LHWRAKERFGAGVAEGRQLLPWRIELTRRLEKRQKERVERSGIICADSVASGISADLN